MPKYNGHKNWNHWNVSLWINNDEGLYHYALECIRFNRTKEQAAESMLNALDEMGYTKTPDGTPYNKTNILAAMRGII